MDKVKIISYSGIVSFLLILFFIFPAKSLEIIRDTELENFTRKVVDIFLTDREIDTEDLNIYFVKSNEINAFVTGGKNMFINTELIAAAEDYREYAGVIAHELAHIMGGHIFSTSEQLSNLSDSAFPIYLLGIISIMAGAAETGIAGVMVGQASVADSFTYFSRTQEASADQAAVVLMCENKMNADYLIKFLNRIDDSSAVRNSNKPNYRSTHPSTSNRKSWIELSMRSRQDCNHERNNDLQKQFELLKAKIFGFTHPNAETEAVYNSSDDVSLYAKAVSNYLKGNHEQSIINLKKLINNDRENPYYKELLGEIYFANQEFYKAISLQLEAINNVNQADDLYLMIIGNYLLATDDKNRAKESVKFLKKSIILNPKNAYSWYLLARAYNNLGNVPFANYATAERYFLIGERLLAYNFASKALNSIEENTPEWYRSSDLIQILEKEVSIN